MFSPIGTDQSPNQPLRALRPSVIDNPDVLKQPCQAPSYATGSVAGPQLSCTNCPVDVELRKLRCKEAYWRKMHQKAVERENKLKDENKQLEAKLRLRERQLFGRKTEKSSSRKESKKTDKPKKPRGHQFGKQGHQRRDYSHLPVIEEEYDLPTEERCCSECGLPFDEFPGAEDSEVIEVEVKSHRRRIKRKRYTPACQCGCHSGVITAPGPGKIIPKGILGVSVWVTILLDKFHFLRPTNRLLADLTTHGLDIATGTVTDGLKSMGFLLQPIYDAIIARNIADRFWHADETRWLVFVPLEGKANYKWYMWVVSSPNTVVYILNPSRSAAVPLAHFGQEAKGILVVDRYSAYKAMAKQNAIILAFCWAHVRRDFLGVAKDWPEHEAWAMSFVEEIGRLYHFNQLRLELMGQPELFDPKNQDLKEALKGMAERRDNELAADNIHPARQKVLQSLKEHWAGLTIFAENPFVPMDNNLAERLLRTPVVGRKVFYGSGARWSGLVAAMAFSLFQTLGLWGINPRLWLTAYLQACADNQGQVPENLDFFLPWKVSEDRLKSWSFKPETKDSS